MTSNEDILNLPSPKPDARVSYGSDRNQFIDLRMPRNGSAHPLAICIHGGFWRARYDLEYLGHMAAALTTRGLVTANIEYRRVGNPGGGWPGTFADIRAACQFLLQNAARYAIDTRHVIVSGHSAGAQLALCLAAHQPELKAAISLAGVIDLQRAYQLHLSNDAVVEFLGGSPSEVTDHYREADPMKLHIKTRQLVVHGAQDEIVPPDLARDYVKAKGKEDARLLMIEGAGHFEVVDPRSKSWGEVERVVLEPSPERILSQGHERKG
jgi:acetyl esterase/lipase